MNGRNQPDHRHLRVIYLCVNTSALVKVVASNGRLLTQLEDERKREMHMRSSLRKEEWEALKRARAAELSERKKTKMQVSEVPSSQRHQIWEEERSREADLRRMVRAEIAELRRKERQDEEKLGTGEAAAELLDKEQGE